MVKALFPGWYQWVYVIQIILALLITLSFSLDIRHASEALKWYVTAGFFTIVFVFADVILDKIFKISLMPTGEYNPDEYPLQRLLGYNGAVLVAIISGIALAIFFGISIVTQEVIYFPVAESVLHGGSQLTTQPLQLGAVSGIIHSVPPTAFENPLLIFLPYLLFKIFIRALLVGFSFVIPIPPRVQKLIASLVAVVGAAIVFPRVFHKFAYDAIEPAYWRASLIVGVNMIPVALTGIPFPIDFGHFTNNYLVAGLQVVAFSTVVFLPQLIVFIKKKYKSNT